MIIFNLIKLLDVCKKILGLIWQKILIDFSTTANDNDFRKKFY